ncbi:hypothetical protein AVEN_221447-1, partial [Araneus ventricosus]
EERQSRLGPGGLDPVEVMESLPEILDDFKIRTEVSCIIPLLLRKIGG